MLSKSEYWFLSLCDIFIFVCMMCAVIMGVVQDGFRAWIILIVAPLAFGMMLHDIMKEKNRPRDLI